MSVVFSEPARKMTPRNKLLVLLVTVVWLEGIAGGSFSNVVVQRDGVVPAGFINYNPPLALGPQAAPISAIPLKSVVGCLAPCIIPDTGSQGLAPIPASANAKIIAYQPAVPNVPVIMTNKEAPRAYQYAYAVYDDNTGDKKSQMEQSDGSVVKGKYSFIQPDGYRREVVYTADDLKGFNAVVRNISPEPELPKEGKEEVAKPQPPPCPEPQNAQLSETPKQSSKAINLEVEQLEQPSRKPKTEPKSVQKNIEISEEKKEEKPSKPEQKPEKEKPVREEPRQTVGNVENSPTLFNNVISYNDIIKCLQTKLISAKSAISPLTYILIPSLQGPC
ncbi:uncharacterized protein LOC112058211 [Bicyclus anynana]|uniref:Uncharacterized protein LOC112058211 n=1 Tax=Bicyclus anynana TaxID=110368 RepID=A0ABM3LHQ9_BICAN|nr:uncharacterized protein LOC112058211 [Bicyclus anynana]